MFNVGGPEVLIILLVALLVLGPHELPKAVRAVGNVMAELRRMSSGFQEEIRATLDGPIEVEARERGAALARTPEEADITDTISRDAAVIDVDPAAVHHADGRPVEALETFPTPAEPVSAQAQTVPTPSEATASEGGATGGDLGFEHSQDPGERAAG